MRLEKAAPQPWGGPWSGQWLTRGCAARACGPRTCAAPLTSWGQRSRPICFSTLRSRSLSSCSLPSEASAAGVWGQARLSVPTTTGPLPGSGATDVQGQTEEPLGSAPVWSHKVSGLGWVGGAAGQGVVGQWSLAGAGGQPRPGVYLGAVLSHGVVVEASLGLELLPAVLALECVLQLQTRQGPNH